MLQAFFARVKPVSTMAKPACMKKTRKAARQVQRVFMSVNRPPLVTAPSSSSSRAESFSVSSFWSTDILSQVAGSSDSAASDAGAASLATKSASVGNGGSAADTCPARRPEINMTNTPPDRHNRRCEIKGLIVGQNSFG